MRTDRAAPAKKPRKKRVWLRVLIAVVVTLLLVAAALAAVFAWDRWYRYDDAADIQGKWYPAGSLAAVQIGPDEISFDAETAYSYTIDTHEKTITYTLGPLQGKGHYWFADDRTTLVVEDGEDFSSRDTALADLGRMVANLGATIGGGAPELPEGDGISVFTREVDPAVVAAKQEADLKAREEEAAKRQAEEAAARAAEEAEKAAAAEEEADEREEDAGEEEAEGRAEDKDAKEEPKDFSNESMGIL